MRENSNILSPENPYFSAKIQTNVVPNFHENWIFEQKSDFCPSVSFEGGKEKETKKMLGEQNSN